MSPGFKTFYWSTGGQVVAGIVLLMLGAFVNPIASYVYSSAQALLGDNSLYRLQIATTTVNVIDIFEGVSLRPTSMEQKTFLEPYKDAPIMGRGIFRNITQYGSGSYGVDISVERHLITCSFDAPSPEMERKLRLLTSGDKLEFAGIFTMGSVWGGGWSIEDCYLL